MDEKTQNALLIVGVLAAGGLVYWHFSSKKDAAKAPSLPTTLGMSPALLLAAPEGASPGMAQGASLGTAQGASPGMAQGASLGTAQGVSTTQIAAYSGPKTATTDLKYMVKSSAPLTLVRSGPTENYPSFGAFQPGDFVASTGFVVTDSNARTAYVEVLTPDNKTGWVNIAFLDVIVPTPDKNPVATVAEGLQSSQIPSKVFVPAPSNTMRISPNASPSSLPASRAATKMYSSILNSGGVPSGYKYPQET